MPSLRWKVCARPPTAGCVQSSDPRFAGLENCTQLHTLWINECSITRMQVCVVVAHHKPDSATIFCCRHCATQGLDTCTNLQSLYLNSNGLTRLAGLGTLRHLNVLWANDNKLTRIEVRALVVVTTLTVANVSFCLLFRGSIAWSTSKFFGWHAMRSRIFLQVSIASTSTCIES